MLPFWQSVTAIIVTYNSAEVIGMCLASLPEGQRIIAVDNASTDGTPALIREHFPHVEIIESPVNLGFGRANNLALEKVATPYALLINPDAVLRGDTLEKLGEAALAYPEAALFAPQLATAEGEFHKSYKPSVFAREKKRALYFPPEGDICADYLSGAVMLLSMAALQKTGFFDPNIFLYYEDDDLCLRIRQHGLSSILVKEAVAVHLGGKSSGPGQKFSAFKEWHMYWSRLYLEQKYYGESAAKKLGKQLTCQLTGKILLNLCALRVRKLRRDYARLQGVNAFLQGRARKA